VFLALGFTNVRRNLGRSVLAVFGAALAAMIITSMVALSSGYPAMGYLAPRAFMAADIVVYSTPHLVQPGAFDAAAAGGADEEPWQLVTLSLDQVSDLQSLHPELYSHGFLSPRSQDQLVPLDVADVAQRLQNIDAVAGITPSFFLPLRLEFDVPAESGSDTRVVALPEMVMRSRDFEFAAQETPWSFDRLLVSGRVPAATEATAPVGLIDARLTALGYEALPKAGDLVRAYLPAVSIGSDGTWSFDYVNETRFDITIIGDYQTPTDIVGWTTPDGATEVEELFWVTPQLQVPAGYFAQVFATVSGGATPANALQVGIAAGPFSAIENIAADVQAALPGYSVITVPSQIELARTRGLPSAAFRAPFDLLGRPTVQQVGLPVDLNQAIMIMVSLIAAMLLAANMLFLVAQRRREIGILKAVGARAWDVGVMILTEALTLNLAGTMIGFLIIRVFATWTLISNHIPLAEIGRTTLSDLMVVVAAGASAAALFALVPAWQMARLTSLEVLRNE